MKISRILSSAALVFIILNHCSPPEITESEAKNIVKLSFRYLSKGQDCSGSFETALGKALARRKISKDQWAKYAEANPETLWLLKKKAEDSFCGTTRYVTAKSGLILREKPLQTSSKKAIIPFGGEVNLINKKARKAITIGEQIGSWVRIQYNNSKGFVFDAYLNVRPPEAAPNQRCLGKYKPIGSCGCSYTIKITKQSIDLCEYQLTTPTQLPSKKSGVCLYEGLILGDGFGPNFNPKVRVKIVMKKNGKKAKIRVKPMEPSNQKMPALDFSCNYRVTP